MKDWTLTIKGLKWHLIVLGLGLLVGAFLLLGWKVFLGVYLFILVDKLDRCIEKG